MNTFVIESHVRAGHFTVPEGFFTTDEEKQKVAALEKLRARSSEFSHPTANEIREERVAELVRLVESGELAAAVESDELPDEVYELFDMSSLRQHNELRHARQIQIGIMETAITQVLHARRLKRADLKIVIITDHLRPALEETMHEADPHASELKSVDADYLVEAGAAALDHFNALKLIGARYDAIRSVYVDYMNEENREILRDRERRLWSEFKNLDQVFPDYQSLTPTQVSPGVKKGPTARPTPWPASTVGKLVWIVQNGAEVWLPLSDELLGMTTAEEEETVARSLQGESDLARKHRQAAESHARMMDSRQPAC